jgi:hypothetical protein
MQKREQIIERARTWVETPVLHQHAILGFGVDCWNLVKAVGEAEAVLQVDAELWAPFAGYGREPSPRIVMGVATTFLRPVEDGEQMAADIACIAWRPNLPMHFAILAAHKGRPTLIHAWKTVEKVCEHGFEQEWPGLVHSWWRYPGLAD